MTVRVKPKAKRTAWLGVQNDVVQLAVTAPPEDGKANQAVLALVKETLNVSGIELLSGPTNRSKVLLVPGLSADELAARIAAVS